MSENDALKRAIEGMVESLPDDQEQKGHGKIVSGDVEDGVLGDLDLPRIVVEGDRIVVEEGDFIERDVGEEIDVDLEEEALVESLEEVVGGIDGIVVSESGEGVSYGLGEKKDSGDLYGSDKLYEDKGYESNAVGSGQLTVDSDVGIKSQAEIEDERRGGRSMLEIVGFKDEEAEKKRKERREFLGS